MIATEMNTPVPPRPLRLGDVAPNFTARTTMGLRSLADYRGKWLLLFSHPADFTPVCTTEFVALARAADRFAALDCALLGLSVDSLYAHIAWVKAIEQAFGVTVPFPIVEDPSMAIGRAYGMLDEQAQDSSAIRCSYFIDPEGIVRAITSYPHNVGRCVEEMIRMVAALQVASRTGMLTPEGWQPGDPTLAPPAAEAAQAVGSADWFCQWSAG
ncbi:MAG: peroxiredoxin [Alteraurantiacibacter sp.]|nr:peroxiredoxin [Alteraurantiacibacter sp.]